MLVGRKLSALFLGRRNDNPTPVSTISWLNCSEMSAASSGSAFRRLALPVIRFLIGADSASLQNSLS